LRRETATGFRASREH